VLAVDGAVERVGGGWTATGRPWAYDGDRYARLTGLGWGGRLCDLLADGAPDAPAPEPLVRACVDVLASWRWPQRPAAVVAVPSRRRPELVTSVAEPSGGYAANAERRGRARLFPSGRGCVMPIPNEHSDVYQPPGWAVDQATADLYDVKDPHVIATRARELARQAEEREDERHDEYDDPDQGGEA
jgi:hypothetical protein